VNSAEKQKVSPKPGWGKLVRHCDATSVRGWPTAQGPSRAGWLVGGTGPRRCDGEQTPASAVGYVDSSDGGSSESPTCWVSSISRNVDVR
jgi:hypothetical protein